MLKINQFEDTLSRLTLYLQGDLIQLESAIDYQNKNNWKEDNVVLEKIEDVKESINYVMVTGKDSDTITKQQEQDLWTLYNFLKKYPDYTGFPNTQLSETDRSKLVELGLKLRTAGWGMNMSYNGRWDSFSKALRTLVE
jgi:hypothetical protein